MIPTDAHVTVIVNGVRGVGRFLIVIKMIPTAAHRHALWVIHLQPPTRHVQKVRAVVLHFATAVVPVPMPVIMHKVVLVSPLRARALPAFPAFFAEPRRHAGGTLLEIDIYEAPFI